MNKDSEEKKLLIGFIIDAVIAAASIIAAVIALVVTNAGMGVFVPVLSIVVIAAVLNVVLEAVMLKRADADIDELAVERESAVAANNAKSDFLSNMSHDIRTPLNAIQGMTKIALDHVDDVEQVTSCLNRISVSGHHLLGLINDVLDMSKIESGKMMLNEDRTSIKAVVDDIALITHTQVEEKNQDFDVRIGTLMSNYVFCDGLRLSQIMLNMLSNAVKFTPEGGNIALSVSQTKSNKGEHYVHLVIKVKDDGIGIDPEFGDRIFDSFERVDSKHVNDTQGVGLGMTITKYIVDAMGGLIEFDSELGKGTEFRVDLDFKRMPDDDEEEKTVAEETAVDDSLRGNMVLVAEDNLINMEVAKAILNDRGIQIEWAENGQICVDMFSSHEAGYYAAILMDLRMPVMTGYEAAAKIRYLDREDAATIPIIAMSADAFAEDIRRCIEAGMDDHLSKPIEIDKLMEALHRFIK